MEAMTSISPSATATAEFTIYKKALTVTAENKEKDSGEGDPALTYTSEGLLEGDAITGALTRETGEEVGEYDILAGTLTAGKNYEMTFVKGKLTIKAAPEEDSAFLQNPFEDVFEKDYYYDPVLWAFYSGITTGTDETHFSPKKACSRAEMVTFIWRAEGRPEPTVKTCPFTDVDKEAYYYKAVLWAYEKGVTLGTGATTFDPNRELTRAESVTFLYRAKGSRTGGINPFKDVSADKYYYEAVLWAAKKGVALGTGDDKFSPDEACLRGQVVTFLHRVYVK